MRAATMQKTVRSWRYDKRHEALIENYREATEVSVGFQHPDTGWPIGVTWVLGQPAEADALGEYGEPDEDTMELVEAIDGWYFPHAEALVATLLSRGVHPDNF